MGTRLPSNDIPSSFIRLDSRVTDPDAYINIRDLQVARLNHNKLIARGIKRHLCTMAAHRGFNTEYPLTFDQYLYSVKPGTREYGTQCFSVPLMLSSSTKEIEVVIRGSTRHASLPSKLYFAVDANRRTQPLDRANYFINITSTATLGARYAITLPVPDEAKEDNMVTLTAWLHGEQLLTGGAPFLCGAWLVMDGYTDRYIDIDTTLGTQPPQFSSIVTPATGGNLIMPNIITRVAGLPGVNKRRLYLEHPIQAHSPPVGSPYIDAAYCTGVCLHSVNIYESSITSFDYDPGVV